MGVNQLIQELFLSDFIFDDTELDFILETLYIL